MDSGTDRGYRCLLIAPLENHATAGRVAALAGTRYQLTVADVSVLNFERQGCYPFDKIERTFELDVTHTDPVYLQSKAGRITNHLVDWLRSYGLLSENKAISAAILAAIREVKPDVVVTFYGPIAIHYARIVKRTAPAVPVVVILNLIPSTLITARSRIVKFIRHCLGNEFADFRNWLRKMDGIVFASEEMRDFVTGNFTGLTAVTLVLPDFLPRSFYGADNQSETARGTGHPSIIFLGAPERYGGTLDSPDEQFVEIARAGIQVYSGRLTGEALRHPFCHEYARFTNEEVFTGKLATFARAHDAGLITYNVRTRHERFRSTFPTRFFTALAAGIPMAIRGGVFDACEKFVEKHQNGFVFSSVGELADVLGNKDRMTEFRRRAAELTMHLHAEAQAEELESFLDAVVNERPRATPVDSRHLGSR